MPSELGMDEDLPLRGREIRIDVYIMVEVVSCIRNVVFKYILMSATESDV